MSRLMVVLTLLALPTFALMLRPGIYTMHDFHPFRQFEFNECLAKGIFPCRWAADASLGYGQPLFNFYGQFSYWIGGLWRALDLSVIDSVKTTFILSLVASGVAMFVLARNYWGNRGGIISALLYIYAPYRAVDVWVRSALPEALGFVFFPLIWLCLDKSILTGRYNYLFWLVLLTTGLLLTHNLSFLMFMPFAGVWAVYRLCQRWSQSKVEDLVSAGLVVVLLAAFYLLPVVFESRLVSLGSIAADYYNYRHHFVSLRQLFWSNFWGYGGSAWGPNDSMSFAIGYLQWLLPMGVAIWLVVAGRIKKHLRWWVIFGLGVGALFLTHGKSEVIWKLLPFMAYIQFPWRFLTVAVFFLALAGGVLPQLLPKSIRSLCLVGLIMSIILINFRFFRPDIWLAVSDSKYFSGIYWDEMRRSAISDFWPKSAPGLPTEFASAQPQVILNTAEYQKIQYPIVYFPGWKSQVDLFPSGPLGLVTARVPKGEQITLKFTNTPVRAIGNWVSLITLLGLVVWRIRYVKA